MALEMDEIIADPEGNYRRDYPHLHRQRHSRSAGPRHGPKSAMSNPDEAHQLLIKEELGINPEDLKSSAKEAAITSFILFAIGAIIPLAPFFWSGGYAAILASVGFSTLGLFIIGSAITLFTGKSIWFSGMRQVLFGLLAAAITFGIGKLIGVSIAG
jgi:VIT1/CCC1 family predicted Fe2+/Mn2+ transporter